MSKSDVRDVSTGSEFIAADLCRVRLHGRYSARERPVRGGRIDRPVDRAVLVLADDFEVWLEPLDQASSVRPDDERVRFDEAGVHATGIAHKVMPATGESPLAPCLVDVQDLTWDER
jgi:hypothetical protein